MIIDSARTRAVSSMGMGHNELLIRDAIRNRRRDSIVISVKFGALRDPRGTWLGVDARPAAVKSFFAYSLRRLGTDDIDIHRPGRVDPNVPIEETVGAIADLMEAGYVRYVGLSEACPTTIRRAHAVHPVTDLQIEYSLLSRGIEKRILPVCRGSESASPRGLTVAQAALAWVMSRGDDIVPLFGARTRDRLDEAMGALATELTEGDLSCIDCRHSRRLRGGRPLRSATARNTRQ